MRKLWILIGVLPALAGLTWAEGGSAPDSGISIHKPLRFPTEVVPYEPDRIIRMTLHDYVKGGMAGQKNETTGRYVTFGLPMKFLNWHMVFPDQSPHDIQTFTEWRQTSDGSGGVISDTHDLNGMAPNGYTNSSRFLARATPFSYSSLARLSNDLIAARQSRAAFDGYKPRSKPGETFWMGETYCGFDVFERDHQRYWEHDLSTPKGPLLPPFDHARVFGLPDGNKGYRLIVECDDAKDTSTGYCKTDAAFNDYIVVKYGFDGSLLCQIDAVIDAHLDLLRTSVSDEQAVKNERWRNR